MITLYYENFREHDKMRPLHYYVYTNNLNNCDGNLNPLIIKTLKKEKTFLIDSICMKCNERVKYFLKLT